MAGEIEGAAAARTSTKSGTGSGTRTHTHLEGGRQDEGTVLRRGRSREPDDVVVEQVGHAAVGAAVLGGRVRLLHVGHDVPVAVQAAGAWRQRGRASSQQTTAWCLHAAPTHQTGTRWGRACVPQREGGSTKALEASAQPRMNARTAHWVHHVGSVAALGHHPHPPTSHHNLPHHSPPPHPLPHTNHQHPTRAAIHTCQTLRRACSTWRRRSC
jgi:hypothetical protein